MANKFSDFRAQMSPESLVRAEDKAQAWFAEMLLKSAWPVAKHAGWGCAFGSRQSPRSKGAPVCIVSTLRSHIEAMGGEWEVVARFPDGAVRINNSCNYSVPLFEKEGLGEIF